MSEKTGATLSVLNAIGLLAKLTGSPHPLFNIIYLSLSTMSRRTGVPAIHRLASPNWFVMATA